jgi:hypothetical protein
MSYKAAPWATGAVNLVPLVGDSTAGRYVGFIVGSLGDAPVPEIVLYMLDGTTLPIKNVQGGLIYYLPNRGVASKSANMLDVYGLIG